MNPIRKGSAIPAVATPRADAPIFMSSLGRVSRPTVKSKKIAPSSPIEVVASVGITKAVRYGPSTTPERISPSTAGNESCSKSSPKIFAHRKITRSCSKNGSAPCVMPSIHCLRELSCAPLKSRVAGFVGPELPIGYVASAAQNGTRLNVKCLRKHVDEVHFRNPKPAGGELLKIARQSSWIAGNVHQFIRQLGNFATDTRSEAAAGRISDDQVRAKLAGGASEVLFDRLSGDFHVRRRNGPKIVG